MWAGPIQYHLDWVGLILIPTIPKMGTRTFEFLPAIVGSKIDEPE